MKIHEYQAKALFRTFGVPVPDGSPAFSVEDAVDAARGLGGYPVVVKAQIHAGGRGKGGGVKLAASEDEARRLAGEILGMTLVTHQTGPQGRRVKKLLDRSGPEDRKRVLSEPSCGQGHGRYCDHGKPGGRHGHRNRCCHHA